MWFLLNVTTMRTEVYIVSKRGELFFNLWRIRQVYSVSNWDELCVDLWIQASLQCVEGRRIICGSMNTGKSTVCRRETNYMWIYEYRQFYSVSKGDELYVDLRIQAILQCVEGRRIMCGSMNTGKSTVCRRETNYVWIYDYRQVYSVSKGDELYVDLWIQAILQCVEGRRIMCGSVNTGKSTVCRNATKCVCIYECTEVYSFETQQTVCARHVSCSRLHRFSRGGIERVVSGVHYWCVFCCELYSLCVTDSVINKQVHRVLCRCIIPLRNG
jgi:hypothetical protein